MAFVTLEDFSGKGDCIVFSDAYRQYQNLLQLEAMVMVIGKAEQAGDSLRIILNEAHAMETVRQRFTKSVVVTLQLDQSTEQTVTELRKVVERHHGKCKCYVHVTVDRQTKPLHFHSRKFSVEPNDQFISDVEKILGAKSVRIMS